MPNRVRLAALTLSMLISPATAFAQNCDSDALSRRACVQDRERRQNTTPVVPNSTGSVQSQAPKTIEAPEQGITHWADWDTSYDPGSAYISSLDVIPTPGTATFGDWTSEVTLTPDGRFLSSSMSTQVALTLSGEPVRITASCDFTAPPIPGRKRPDVTMTVTYSPKVSDSRSALRGMGLRRDSFGRSGGISVWTIGPQSAVAGQQEWPIGQMLPSQFFEEPTMLWLEYDNGPESAVVSRNGFRAAFSKLVPCWSYTTFWDQQYARGRATR